MNQIIVNKFVQSNFHNSNFSLRADHLNSFLLDLSRVRGLLIYLGYQQNPIDQLLSHFNINYEPVFPDNQLDNLMQNMNDNEKITLKATLSYFIFMYMDRAIYNMRNLHQNTFPPNLLIFDIEYNSIYYDLVKNCRVNEHSENTLNLTLDFLHQYISGIVE